MHLAGIGFAAAYLLSRLEHHELVQCEWLAADAASVYGPRLKVTKPSTNRDEDEADRILQKIHEKGQDSLTRSEKKFMQKYSRSVGNAVVRM